MFPVARLGPEERMMQRVGKDYEEYRGRISGFPGVW
jgi:hypothetical protein